MADDEGDGKATDNNEDNLTGWDAVKSRLLAQAPEVSVNQNVKLDYYFNSIQNYREQGRQHAANGDYERAFICLMRYANVAVGTIRKHKEYKLEKYSRDRRRVNKQLENILVTLEQLKERLKDKYDNPTKQEFEEEEDAAPSDAVAAVTSGVAALAVAGEVKDSSADIASPISTDADRWANLRIPAAFSNKEAVPASADLVNKRVQQALQLQRIKIPLDLMDKFLQIAKPNTKKDVETCGILGGSLIGDFYQITHLIIPRQEGTSNTVVTYDEEKLIDVQASKGLITLGWIHTHPSQSCFMSSVDLHTHYGYQIMLPEAIAIVMAPSKKKDSGVFSITKSGMSILEKCSMRGFHQHDESEGVYGEARHAEIDPNCGSIQVLSLAKI